MAVFVALGARGFLAAVVAFALGAAPVFGDVLLFAARVFVGALRVETATFGVDVNASTALGSVAKFLTKQRVGTEPADYAASSAN
ncbi:hypothetical protein Q5Y75_23745 [Ruegeria sp. 2205SS24-7]|uniref:hypothetical protein n=1 Tax=Ruegeria discodermiae TaxID=3064389 RepID=UPI002740C7D4|nr:hypothetical protein [Ruegeria sp. 2205SS24-7]MDP5220209.1 hypothetical protein [Ruegeria sp. 2205SS24-7]